MSGSWIPRRTGAPVAPVALVAAVLALVMGLGACDGDDGGSAGPTTSTTSPDTTTTGGEPVPTTVPCEPPPGDFGTDPRRGDAAGSPPAYLSAIEAAPGDCVETVRFAFEGATPAWDVHEAAPPFREDASGRLLEVEGEAFLEVVFDGASGVDLSGEGPRETYRGPVEVEPSGTVMVREVQRTGDFEGVMRWVIGLDARHPFGVTVADGAVVVTVVATPA